MFSVCNFTVSEIIIIFELTNKQHGSRKILAKNILRHIFVRNAAHSWHNDWPWNVKQKYRSWKFSCSSSMHIAQLYMHIAQCTRCHCVFLLDIKMHFCLLCLINKFGILQNQRSHEMCALCSNAYKTLVYSQGKKFTKYFLFLVHVRMMEHNDWWQCEYSE